MFNIVRRILKEQGQGIVALALLLLGVIVYFPSFFHIARADQLNYLADTARLSHWYDLAIGTFDLNRTRLFGAGDEIFFRPVLYFILGNEKAFFGCHYPLWQIAGFLAHAAVCFCLWRVLNLIHRGAPALLATAFFAFLYANLEAVIWHHITAYVVFALLILIAMEMALKYAAGGAGTSRHLIGMVLVLALALFTYEVGLWYCLCFLFFIRAYTPDPGTRRKATGWFLLPCFLYGAASLANALWLKAAILQETKVLAGGFDLFKTVQNFIITLKWDIFSGFFLTNADVTSNARLAVAENVFSWMWPLPAFKPYYLLGVLMIVAWGLFLWQGRRGIEAGHKRLLGWLAMMLAGYILIIVIARVNPLGFAQGMLSTLYYLYNFWVLFMVFLYAAASAVIGKGGRMGRVAGWALVVLMVVFTVCNAVMVYRQNKWVAYLYKPTWTFVSRLNSVVDAHGKEPDFSFYVRPDHPGNYLGRWFVKGKPEAIYSFAEILYPQFYKELGPKYVLLSASLDSEGTLCVRGPVGGYQCGMDIPGPP